MSSEGVVAVVEHRLHRFFVWFDHEAAAVVTILLGLIQVLLSVPLAYSNQTLPKLFILPLFLGLLIVAGGSFTIANERNSSRLLLRGCACSNVVGLLVALLAFVVYCYSLSTISNTEPCDNHNYPEMFHGCPREMLATYCWRVTLLLLLYDTMAVILHGFLSVSALKALKTH